jgi:hypothetical protein
MSQAYAQRAKGDYLWQVDIDEFYHPEDMRLVIQMVAGVREITAVSFQQITFWGGFDFVADGWYLKRGAEIYHRLFKWQPGYRYVSHRPPTVQDQAGRDLRKIKWIDGYELAARNIYLYHYSLLLPKQVNEKSSYYGAAAWAERPYAQKWAEDVFFRLRRPYRVHNVYQYPSWLESYSGRHPPQINALRADIESNLVSTPTRETEDIRKLLSSPTYRLGRQGLKSLSPLANIVAQLRWRFRLWCAK